MSRVQAGIDKQLDPARYAFAGTPAQRTAALAAMKRAIAAADAAEDKNEHAVDDERTQSEEGTLRIAAGTALRDAATTRAQRAAGLALLGQGQGDHNDWTPPLPRSIAAHWRSNRTIPTSWRRSRARTTAYTIIPT